MSFAVVLYFVLGLARLDLGSAVASVGHFMCAPGLGSGLTTTLIGFFLARFCVWKDKRGQ